MSHHSGMTLTLVSDFSSGTQDGTFGKIWKVETKDWEPKVLYWTKRHLNVRVNKELQG